jgi:hypothetical protein
VRGIDGGHAAAAEFAEDFVLAQRGSAEELEFVGVGGVHGGGHPVGFLSGTHSGNVPFPEGIRKDANTGQVAEEISRF